MGDEDGRAHAFGSVRLSSTAHFGYTPTVYLPKPGKNPFYESLKKQVTNLDIPVISSLDEFKAALGSSDCALDAIFGTLSAFCLAW